MRKKFILEAFGENEADVIDKENAEKIEAALSRFVKTNVPLKIECEFVSEEEIRRLNAEKRNIDKVTDVLSFPELENIKGKPIKKSEHPFELDEDGALLIGSLAVCVKRAKEQAAEYNHSYYRELNYLIVHGILHCLGYDHIEEEDRAEMRAKEEEILGGMGITREA